MLKARAIRQVKPATGAITADLFAEQEVSLTEPAQGEVTVRPEFISVDPYLVMRFRDDPFPQGAVRSRIIGTVEQSRAEGLREGDKVIGFGEWQDVVVAPANEMRVIVPRAPLPAYLGVLGHSGYTATLGMNILDVQAGQTFSVSSAAGMVGMVAGQLAQMAGARVVGIAGGDKAIRLVDKLGFDAGVNYRDEGFLAQLATAAPDGIDRHFENVGAAMMDPVLGLANSNARIALCGLIAHYSDSDPVCFRNFKQMLFKAVTIKGFNIADHLDHYLEGLARLEELYLAGKIQGFEVVTDGFENLPATMVSMLAGEGFGKHMVRI